MKKTLAGLTLAAAFGFTALAASPAAAAPPYANCDAANAEGAFSIKVGEPGYEPRLDRDGDGVACEGTPPNGTNDVIADPPATTDGNQVIQTPRGGANTGVAIDKGTDATGMLLAAGGIAAVAGVAFGVRRKSGNHA